MTESSGMNVNLEWLARNVGEWSQDPNDGCVQISGGSYAFLDGGPHGYKGHNDFLFTKAQWLQARKDLGLIMSDAEEELPAKEWAGSVPEGVQTTENRSDGSTASYYELPPGCTELQDLISYRNLNAQDGEIFRAIYRKGRASHSDELRDARKVLFYAKAEVERLERKFIG